MPYNLLPYNRGLDNTTIIESTAIFKEKVYFDYTKSVALKSEIVLFEKINFAIQMNKVISKFLVFKETVCRAIDGTHAISCLLNFSVVKKADAWIGKEMKIDQDFSEIMKSKSDFGKEMRLNQSFKEVLYDFIDLSKLLNSMSIFQDVMNLLSSANSLIEELTILNVEIPSGATLEIDSEVFTVTLNGINVFDKHSGEWVFLSKDLVDVEISALGNEIETTVIYRERYL